MTICDRSVLEDVLASFDEYLRRVRGVCAGTRFNYTKYVGEFLRAGFPEGVVDLAEIHARDVVGFVGGLSGRYQPRRPPAPGASRWRPA